MIAAHRKLFILKFLGVSGALFGLLATVSCQNDTVVMKINKSDIQVIHPRVMINKHNEKMREKLLQSRTKRPGLETTQPNLTSRSDSDILNSTNSTEFEDNSQRLYFPYNLKVISEVLKKLENGNCVRDTIVVLDSMTKHEKWALEIFDSFSKFPTGILSGNYFQLGNFDECVEAKQLPKPGSHNEKSVQGQYCLADIHFEPKTAPNGRYIRSSGDEAVKKNRYEYNNTVIYWGICLPSSCSTLDAQIFTKEIFSSAAENFDVVSVVVDHNKCYYDTPEPFTVSEITYGCIVGAFLIFTFLVTGWHIWYLRQRKKSVAYNVDTLRSQQTSWIVEFLTCFSLIHTTKKFLSTKPNEFNLECICGIKFLSMTMIIMGHALIFALGGAVENKKFLPKEFTKIENGIFLNNPLLVDTFLLISGFLMCRLLLLELEKRKGKLNIMILYIARYIRLTPAYAVVLGFHITWLYRMGNGPFWNSRVGLERDRCLNSWWTNLLYVNNYVDVDQLCMFQSWYLAVDYHLFIVAPLIIYLLWRWTKMGETVLFLSAAVSMAVPFWLTYENNYDPTLMVYAPEIRDLSSNFYFANVYIKTHMRASSYCIGLAFGYIVHKLQSSSIKISSFVIILGWIMSTSFAVLSMFTITIFYAADHEKNNLESAIYASLHRTAWCLAIGWIVLVCVTDNAGIINKFLSWKPFIPLSRLTYCAYLANGLVEVYDIGVRRQAIYLTVYEIAAKGVTHFAITMSIAFVLCVCFESPIHGMEKILLSREKRKEQKHNSTLTPLDES